MKTILSLLVILSIAGCTKEKESSGDYSFDFKNGTDGWNAFFSDYHVDGERFYELGFEHTRLPEPLDTTVPAIRITGNNHSDDLVAMIYRKFDGLKPKTTYSVSFDITLASDVPTNFFGAGGAPDLALGAGGIPFAPASTIDEEGLYRPNFSSALQSRLSNDTLQMLGTTGVGEDITVYTLINRNNTAEPINLTTSDKGDLWLMIGTDSGFEGVTTLYYSSIKIKLRELS